ncbi:MAG: hypothetical protein Q9163_004442 [Psora crenata]
MGKGVASDRHPSNTASARSTALKDADVAMVIGARLNWILHFGEAPKWNPNARFVQVDISPEEIGQERSHGDPGSLVSLSSDNLRQRLRPHRTHPLSPLPHKTQAASSTSLKTQTRWIYHAPSFRLLPTPTARRGTYATIGVGMGYAIAAHAAYNDSAGQATSGPAQRKKIVCLERDSAFRFSAMEVETIWRYGMDGLIYVMNNRGVYHGNSDNADEWLKMREQTQNGEQGGLRSMSLGCYEKIAEGCGVVGKAYLVSTPEDLERGDGARVQRTGYYGYQWLD